MSAREYYKNNIDKNKKEKSVSEKNELFMAGIRIALTIASIIIAKYFFDSEQYLNMAITIAISIIIFVLTAIAHGKVKQKIKKYKIAIDLNQKGLDRLDDKWRGFSDKGEEFI